MTDALRQFEEGEGNDIELSNSVELIVQYSGELTDEQVFKLWGILQGRSDAAISYGPDFDIREEIERQLVAVRAMRDAVITPGGQVRPGTQIREIKEVVTASSTLLTTLMKVHEKVMSFDRSRAIEEAVTTTMQKLPDEERKAFFAVLEENLARIE